MKKIIVLLVVVLVGLVAVAQAEVKVGLGAMAGFVPGISVNPSTTPYSTAPSAFPALRLSADNFVMDLGFYMANMSVPNGTNTNTYSLIVLKPVFRFSADKFAPHIGGVFGFGSQSNWGGTSTSVLYTGLTTGASYKVDNNFEIVVDYMPVSILNLKQGSNELNTLSVGIGAVSAFYYF
jgi:hypothetical protein